MLVIAGQRGQLANRIFPFANLIAFAADAGARVINPAFHDQADWFVGTSSGRVAAFPPDVSARPGSTAERLAAFHAARWALRLDTRLRFVPLIRRDDDDRLDFEDHAQQDTVRKLLRARFVLFDALYLIASGSFVRHAARLRAYFAPVPEIAARVSAHLVRARNGGDVLVGIHARQGDYRTQKPRYYHSSQEYAGLMRAIVSAFAGRKVRFLVCSDSVQDPSAFGGLPVRLGPGRPADDLFALAGCDFIAGPPSTFSQWASFYGQVPRYVWQPLGTGGDGGDPPLPQHFRVHQEGYGRFTGLRSREDSASWVREDACG